MDKSNPFRGDSVTFTCDKRTVDSNPEASFVGWYKDEQQLGWPNTSFLFTMKVTPKDSGIYKCIVGNIIVVSNYSNWVQVNVGNLFSEYKNFFIKFALFSHKFF